MKQQIINIAAFVMGVIIGLTLVFIINPIIMFVAFIAVTGLWFFVGRKRQWRPLFAFAVGMAIAIPIWTILFQFRAS